MGMLLANFARRLADWINQNRLRLVKLLLILAAAVLVVFLIYLGVEKFQRWQYEKRVQALEKQYQDRDADAKAAEARAHAKEEEIQAKEVELQNLEIRATAAENALRAIRNVNVNLKGDYEKARTDPVPFTPISIPDACIRLAELGHPCQ